MYDEEDFLPLSGIQHYAFCKRQWALIHIENQWHENLRTVEGKILHEKAHEGSDEKRGKVIISRGMHVFSRTLGISGICDVVELHADPAGVGIFGREGLYKPVPIEYKRGKPKPDDSDSLQLCAQAVCLEEMLLCKISQGFMYYGETRHRFPVMLDEPLRAKLCHIVNDMHGMFSQRYTPKVKPSKVCNACSLKDLCMPKLCKNISAADYIRQQIEGATN